ncbi:hypothetical protein PVK06_048125 [Gossypium arboreum]|uniref:Uncharacterized protein n=1 Tax=Gossypium arboreum TaxID=29729 RepID=A0ABR0MF38_GOSAR|nr:hypothetical protein PVK06_048125 [Gossypium arboreum]
MPPRKGRKINEFESLTDTNPLNFVNSDIRKYFTELQGKTFIQERGFDLLIVLSKEIWPLVRYHRWEHYWMFPKKNVVVPIVQDFYASLRDHKSRNTEGCMWDMVLVRGKKVQKKQVCIGKWIHQNMRRCIGSQKLTNTEQEKEVHDSEEEEEEEDEENDGSEEMDEEDD